MRLRSQVAQATVKAYSYQRFSSPSQANGDSLARQTALAKAYAEQHGLHLDDELTYRDLGVSGFRGKNAAHGELACFLEAVRTGQIPEGSFLLIESLDRLSRDNILRAQAILTNLVVSGVNVVSLADNRLYSEESLSDDPLSLIYALIVFIRANEESATKSMRARQA
jgi:DNA invertase Pin-like site-specific DNA recombinase